MTDDGWPRDRTIRLLVMTKPQAEFELDASHCGAEVDIALKRYDVFQLEGSGAVGRHLEAYMVRLHAMQIRIIQWKRLYNTHVDDLVTCFHL